MADALPAIKNQFMPSHPDANSFPPARASSAPPRRVPGSLVASLVAYVSAVSVGIAAVAALATAGVPVESWVPLF